MVCKHIAKALGFGDDAVYINNQEPGNLVSDIWIMDATQTNKTVS